MFTDQTAIDFFSSNMILARIHAEQDTVVASKYHARAYPTSILLNKNGEEIDRLVGYDTTDAYLKTFVDFSNGIGTLDDLLGRAEAGGDRSLDLEIADKYKWRGEVDNAKAWFARVIQAGDPLDSMSGEARISEADMYRRDEDYDKAIETYQKIADEFTSYHGIDAVIYIGLAQERKGDTAQAIATFESYIEQFPESEDVEYAQKRIAELNNPPEEAGE